MSLTRGRFVGTPEFASPEQFEHSALDVRSDIYSLGETLWFALTGKMPFVGHRIEEIHHAQQSDVLPIEQLKAAHVPSSPQVAARIDARTGAGVPARHTRISSAPATLLPRGTQRATHARRSRIDSNANSWCFCILHLPLAAHPKFSFESRDTGEKPRSPSV